MEFRTEIESLSYPFKISHQDKVLCLGSCFADLIGGKLSAHKFQVLSNPLGISFDPVSLGRMLLAFTEDQSNILYSGPVDSEGLFRSWFLHSEVNGESPEGLKLSIRKKVEEGAGWLKETNLLILTLGTAWVWRKLDDGSVVANCHKQPGDLFVKECLQLENAFTVLETALIGLLDKVPGLQVLISVSPVRHTRQGLMGNGQSKAILRVLADKLVSQFERVHYFPAFEIMTDDLRDYRFYQDDLIHPSAFAEAYIWKKFAGSFFEGGTDSLVKMWSDIRRSLAHKPLNPGSDAHRSFLEDLRRKLERLQGTLPVEAELQQVKDQLN